MRWWTTLATGAVLFCAGAAHADDDDKIDCAKAVVQYDLNVCADRAYQAADRKLNETYRAVMAGLGDAARTKLRAAQRKWIVSRDRECKAEAEGEEGGSLYPMTLSGCLADKTKARTKELQSLPR